MANLRDEPRWMCSELVSVLYEDCFGLTRKAVANLEEISSGDATLLAEQNIQSGQPISFCAKGQQLYGSVESSAFDPTLGWFLKIALDAASRWNGRMFIPEHFFALCASTQEGLKEVAAADGLRCSPYAGPQVPEKNIPA